MLPSAMRAKRRSLSYKWKVKEKIELASTYFAGLAVKYGMAASMEKLTKIEQAKVDELLKNARLQDVVAHLYFNDRKSYDTLFNKTCIF